MKRTFFLSKKLQTGMVQVQVDAPHGMEPHVKLRKKGNLIWVEMTLGPSRKGWMTRKEKTA
jgi:hypothetical protein